MNKKENDISKDADKSSGVIFEIVLLGTIKIAIIEHKEAMTGFCL